MTHSEIAEIAFDASGIEAWVPLDKRHSNWPVVYVLEEESAAPQRTAAKLRDVYVGETLSAASRLRQHLTTLEKQHLVSARVIVNETFNKSVCLDLESHLIRLLSGDGALRVINRNVGVTDSNYYNRSDYRETFDEIFEKLRADGLFSRSVPEIENSDLFKLSPFKALTPDQAVAVEQILEGLFSDLETGKSSISVVQGDPGTGKTVVAIFLLKLLADIANPPVAEPDADTIFSDFFTEGFAELVAGLRVGIVVPQQSLRTSIKRVFAKTPGLNPARVMSAFEVGSSNEKFDLLVVDEAHRLNQRANQASAALNSQFASINEALFEVDDFNKTQLDWITAKSEHTIFLVDAAQSVRPADVAPETLAALVSRARRDDRFYPLASQMRVKAGDDYVGYVRAVLAPDEHLVPVTPKAFPGYDLRFFDSFSSMRSEIAKRDAEGGLARVIAGYAWKWVSRKDKSAFDIEIDGERMRWNGTQTDWIASANSIEEVGSIHTVQGYDLNFAGVIIGPDLRYDIERGRLIFDRKTYADTKGKENNAKSGKKYSDEELLKLVSNIYAVLLTRGMQGTYVYVCDPSLREYLRKYLSNVEYHWS